MYIQPHIQIALKDLGFNYVNCGYENCELFRNQNNLEILVTTISLKRKEYHFTLFGKNGYVRKVAHDIDEVKNYLTQDSE